MLHRLLIVAFVLLAWVAETASATPVVAFTAPASNTRYLPQATINLAVNASDAASTISRVDFYNGTTLIGTTSSAPYTFSWSSVPAGIYTVTAKAVNSLNQSKTSSAIKVIVNTPPTITLDGPIIINGDTGPMGIDLIAHVADADGDNTITKVDFYHGGTLIGTQTAPPYTFIWQNFLPGTYSLSARVTDNTGATATSATASVTLVNPITVAMTSPATNSKFLPPATISLSANAADMYSNITQVDFYAGTTLIGTATTAPYSITWNNPISGSYLITAKATDSQGITKTSSAIRVIVNTPPTVSLTQPVTGTSYVGLANINLAADVVDPDGTITKVQFYRGSTLISTTTTPPYTATWANAPPGTYSITARGTDNLGGVTVSSPVTTITVTNPVSVNLTAPLNNARYIPPAAIDLTADAIDTNSTIAKVDFYNGTTLIGTSTSAPYTLSWPNVPAGKYTITAQGTDSQGIVKTSTAAHITVDTSPNVSVTSPVNNANFTAPTAINLAADVSDSDGTISKVQFYNGGTLLATLTSPPYVYAWNNVVPGNYTIKARATDNLGVTTTSTGVLIHVLAAVNVPPTISFTGPADNASYIAPAPINISMNASDSDGTVAQVDLYQGATLLTTLTSQPYTFNWTNATPGNYTLFAKATDNLGATTQATPIHVTVVANIPPQVTLTSPITGTGYTAPGSVVLSAIATDSDDAIAKVEFFQNGTLIATMTTSPYTYTWSNVAAGTYAITAKATDSLGMSTTSTPTTITVASGPASVYYIQTDHLNTPRLITDSSNNPVWQWDNSDPFGANVPNQDPNSTGNAFDFNLRMPGQYADKETGLFYNYFRDYDPATGRYVESDPIGLAGGLNTYGYVNQNALSFTDSKGLVAGVDDLIGGGLILGGLILSSPQGQEAAKGLAGDISKTIDKLADICKPDNCAPLYAQIESLVNQLQRRYRQLRENKGNLPPDGLNSIAGHKQQFRNRQAQLRSLLSEANAKGCTAYRSDAWEWATMPVPSAAL